ncbi:MAG: hypothetical protein NTV36_02935, partial [Candidatus Staskawiczbacteria bacterium]|nr:hypothetical protein [Candidatus Staskawiczbacteria bacterium]
RADCLVELTDGAQKKSQIIADLSNEILKLMNTCSCTNEDGTSKCENTCGGDAGCNQPEVCDGTCPSGTCQGAGCKQGKPDCCPDGVKDKIENGPVEIGCGADNSPKKITKNSFTNSWIVLAETKPAGDKKCATCDVSSGTYNGLDEFRCPNPNDKSTPCDNIPNFVEKKYQLNKKEITVIDQEKWTKLNLIQQLTYFKEKIDQIKQKIQLDTTRLTQAQGTLAKCYLAIPYSDLLKTSETTNKNQKVISIQKTFIDPETNALVNSSKYCKGYNYGNSSCLKQCNDLCPDTGDKAVECYSKAPVCDDYDPECLQTQEAWIEDCYSNERLCTKNSKNPNQTFQECINSCQDDCKNDCTDKYLPCSTEFTVCNNLCKSNSQCVLSNAGNCLFGAEGFQQCASQTTDPGNTKYCIENAYACKNGSDENAGYKECSNDSKTVPAICKDQYSASFFYQYPECQKCPNPYSPPKNGSSCYSKTASADTSCQTLCPETTKCPASSNCAECSCDKIDTTLKFSVPSSNVSINGNPGENQTLEKKIEAYRITSPECNEYSYNDDPLTFYCEDSWWKDPNKEGTSLTPIGSERKCSEGGEIPVGQAVDDAKNWSATIIKSANKEIQDIRQLFNVMDTIGKAKDTSPIQNYCKCDANFSDGDPICRTSCAYTTFPEIDADGNPVFDENGDFVMDCSCGITPCQGSPCQQIMMYLLRVWTSYKQLKLNFIDAYTMSMQEPRSDILKELSFSRQKTNECSLVNSAFGQNARMLSCTRVEHELISPINTGKITIDDKTFKDYCYGKRLGNLLDTNLTNNWFCCQQWEKSPELKK